MASIQKLEKKCIFCGQILKKGQINFEHVISKWLVEEADLQSRTMEVPIGDKIFSVAMNRIGGKACISCNSVRSDMEAKAKSAYEKIKQGDIFQASDIENLLDWMDKVRVGIWLWSLETSAKKLNIKPKFHLSSRIGTKDRIVFINRYPNGPEMKGLELYGITLPFFRSPSSFGMLINNIALYSVSYEFILQRHTRNINFVRHISPGLLDYYDVEDGEPSSPLRKIEILGVTDIFGQQITYSEGHSTNNAGDENLLHEKGNIVRLNNNLSIFGDFVEGKIDTTDHTMISRCLNEINVSLAMDFVLRDYVLSDFSEANPYAAQREIEYFNRIIEFEAIYRARMKNHYYQLTGIRLLN